MPVCDAKACDRKGTEKLGNYFLCDHHWIKLAYDCEIVHMKKEKR